jgi:hypothetical protein
MSRYFFHYRTDRGLIRDSEGMELPDLAAAEHNAAELGKAIIDRAAGAGDDTRAPRSIEITDANGHDLLYVVFWAAPKMGNGSGRPVEPASLH